MKKKIIIEEKAHDLVLSNIVITETEVEREDVDVLGHDLDPGLDHLILVAGIKEVVMKNLPNQLYHKYVNNEMYLYNLCYFQIYDGKVSSIMQFGCFVQLEGVRGRHEGLVHVSQVL